MRYFIAALFVGLTHYGHSVFGHITGAWTAAASIHADAPRELATELAQVISGAWVLPIAAFGFVSLVGFYLLYVRVYAASLVVGLFAAALFIVNTAVVYQTRALQKLTRDLAAVQIHAPVKPELDEHGKWVGVRGDSLLGDKFIVYPGFTSSGPTVLEVAQDRTEFSLFSMAIAAALALLPLTKTKEHNKDEAVSPST